MGVRKISQFQERPGQGQMYSQVGNGKAYDALCGQAELE